MAIIWIKTQYPGVRYYEHSTRKHSGKSDRNFVIRYKKGGRLIGETVGWSSSGMNAQTANRLRSEIMQNIREGKGHQSLAEKRKIEEDRRIAETASLEAALKENITFGEAARAYLKWSKANKKSFPADHSRYATHLKCYDNIPMKEISPLALEKLKRDLKKKELSDTSVHHALTLIRMIYRKAVLWDMYDGPIPTEKVNFPKLNNKRLRFLSHEEADLLLDELEKVSKQIHHQAVIALECGLRFGEIANLVWSDVDLDNGIIHVRDAKTGDRPAYITDSVGELFRTLVGTPHEKNDLIFPDTKGKRQKQISRTFWKVIGRIGFNNGVTDRRQKMGFHTLRHTFASWLAIQGTPLHVIQELLGHASIQMTERYKHLLPDVKQKAVNRMSSDFREHKSGKVVRMERG